MNAKIISGFLFINRNGEWRQQFCPFAPKDKSIDIEGRVCGERCPLFEVRDGHTVSKAVVLRCTGNYVEHNLE